VDVESGDNDNDGICEVMKLFQSKRLLIFKKEDKKGKGS